MTEPRRRQFAEPSLRQSRSSLLRVHRSKQGCSWYAGKESARRVPVRPHGQPTDQAGCPWRPGSDHAKTRLAVRIRVDVAVELFPGWTEPTPREWSRGAIRAHARFPRQSTSPPAAIPKASAQSQYAYGKGVPLPQRRRLEPACIHCLRADQQKSIPSPEWWYVLQFACVWTQLKHGSAGNDW